MMKGKLENDLNWPFKGKVEIQLLNQVQDEGHHKRTVNFGNYDVNDAGNRVIIGEESSGRLYNTINIIKLFCLLLLYMRCVY